MAWRLRLVGRWFMVAVATIAWLVLVPIIELARARPKRQRPDSPLDNERNAPVTTTASARSYARP